MAAEPAEIRGTKFVIRDTGEGYAHIEWDEGAEVSIDDAEVAVDAVNQLCRSQRLPLLVDMSGMRSISREARKRFNTITSIRKAALITRSALSRTIGSFFIGLNRNPAYETRLFTDRTEAINWLLQDER